MAHFQKKNVPGENRNARTEGRGVNPAWSPAARAAPPFSASQAIAIPESTESEASLSKGAAVKTSLQTMACRPSLLGRGQTRPVLHLSTFGAFCGVCFQLRLREEGCPPALWGHWQLAAQGRQPLTTDLSQGGGEAAASSSEREDSLERARGPGRTPSWQVISQTGRSEMQTDSGKTVANRLLVSLMDLSEGHVFLTGREPWCRNRL